MKIHLFCLPLLAIVLMRCADDNSEPLTFAQSLRIATFNIQDIRTADLTGNLNPRLAAAATIINSIQPDILLINEMSYDMAGIPGYIDGRAGLNAQRFADRYLVDVNATRMVYSGYMPATNTGVSSGFDLDNSGQTVNVFPEIAPSNDDGWPPRQSAEGRAFGNDSWGFGTFPGQYGMALFVRNGLSIDSSAIQTFQTFRWSDLPDAQRPIQENGEPWYNETEWAGMRLSSKNHSIVPVRLENGQTVSIVASHPTPPAFDGREMRNKKRNHDEIRLLAEIVQGNPSILSDQGTPSFLNRQSYFVVVGDLNADPDEGSSFNNPIENYLFSSDRINSAFTPVAADSTLSYYPKLDADDTAQWGLRVDYVLPSVNLTVMGSGVYRLKPGDRVEVSDHFPVWVDIQVPPINRSN